MIVQLKKRVLWAALACAGAALIVWLGVDYTRDPTAGRVATLLPKKVAPTVLGWPVRTTAVAGDGTAGTSEGLGRAARFSDPFGIVVDASGVLYVADAGDNNRIRKIAPDGTVSTLAGGNEGYADGIGVQAAFHTPSGLALDKAGNLYVADTGNNAIRKVTPKGVVTTLAGGGPAGDRDGVGTQAQFNGPLGVALDKAGNVLVADTYNDRIRRIAPDGTVTTLAGSVPGNLDGPAGQALFDTPSALAVNAQGVIWIADLRNESVRKLTPDGMVSSVMGVSATDEKLQIQRPVSLAATADGFVYVGDMARGRIWQIDPAGAVHGLTGLGIDIAIGDALTPRLARPAGIALSRDGALYVADSVGRMVRKMAPRAAGESAYDVAATVPAAAAGTLPVALAPSATLAAAAGAAGAAGAADAGSPTALKAFTVSAAAASAPASFPWPIAPQDRPHEVVGTVGECRGSYDGESRHHFHNGLDVQAPMGAEVLAVVAEKVSNPLPNWAYGDVGEGMSIDSTAYLHMRVGRNAKDAPLDASRFTLLRDAKGKPNRVRIKRGTRFAVGDALGTVNRMFHVHLIRQVAGGETNPISLPFPGLVDSIAPRIDAMTLVGADGKRLIAKRAKRLLVPQSAGPLALVVEAYDQMDGNAARRKLGLYKLGYQVLKADGSAMPGFETPVVNIEFNRLPPDQESVKVAYAEQSGITVYGSASTRFLYVATNIVRDGRAQEGSWNPASLAPGDYILRAHAADFAGNVAGAGRDLAITVE